MILIATPIRGAELHAAHVTAGYAFSVAALAREPLVTRAYLFSLDVVRARNRAVGEFLADPGFAQVSHVLWWDDDQWPEDVRIVREMVALNVPIVGAPYTNKKTPIRWTHQEHPWSPTDRLPPPEVDDRGCLDVRGVGMGFTLTSRACLEAMSNHPTTRWYWDAPKMRADGTRAKCPDLFGQLYDRFDGDDALLSEDYSFCKRWREIHGGRVLVYMRRAAGPIRHAGMHAWGPT